MHDYAKACDHLQSAKEILAEAPVTNECAQAMQHLEKALLVLAPYEQAQRAKKGPPRKLSKKELAKRQPSDPAANGSDEQGAAQ